MYRNIGEATLQDELTKCTNVLSGYMTDVIDMLSDQGEALEHEFGYKKRGNVLKSIYQTMESVKNKKTNPQNNEQTKGTAWADYITDYMANFDEDNGVGENKGGNCSCSQTNSKQVSRQVINDNECKNSDESKKKVLYDQLKPIGSYRRKVANEA